MNTTATLTLKLSLHLVQPPPSYLDRQAVRDVVTGINTIWSAAAIQLSLDSLNTPEIADWPDWAAIAGRWPSPCGIIHGYYGWWDGQPNGISFKERVYFVRDHRYTIPWTPLLHRVSSHEIGHILGLSHYDEPKGYLMTSNDAGTALTQQEIEVARCSANTMMSHL